MSSDVYCVDASSIIELAHNYPEDVFPGVWAKMDELLQSGRLVVHERVRSELLAKTTIKSKKPETIDQAGLWASALPKEVIVPIDQAQGEFINRMTNDHKHLRWLVTQPSYRDAADPFLVGLGATQSLTVITEESRRQWHLADLCRRYDVPILDRFGFMRAESWIF